MFYRETLFSHYLSPGGGVVLGISSDGDDRRIFLGLKFSIPGIFGELDLSRDFLGGFKKNR